MLVWLPIQLLPEGADERKFQLVSQKLLLDTKILLRLGNQREGIWKKHSYC
jgi:hypothetical protein